MGKLFSYKQVPILLSYLYLILLISAPLSNLSGDWKAKISIFLAIIFFELAINGFSNLGTALKQRSYEFIFLFSWLFILSLYRFFNIGDMVTWSGYFRPYIYFLSSILIGSLYFNNIEIYRNFIKLSTLVICATSILIIKDLYYNPNIVRFMNAGINILQNDPLNVIGAINYFSGIVLFSPFMISLLSYYRKHRTILWTLVFAYLPFIASLALSTMLTPIILVLFAAIFMLFIYGKKESTPSGILFAVLLLTSLIAIFVLQIEQATFITRKISEFYHNLLSGDVQYLSRINDAIKSIESFIDSPILGIGLQPRATYAVLGEHSTLLDALAEFGVLGFAPFLLFLYLTWNRIFSYYCIDKTNIWNRSRVTVFSLYLISILINPWGLDGYSAVFWGALVLGPTSLQHD